jgi:predicted dienelactone hydrolase
MSAAMIDADPFRRLKMRNLTMLLLLVAAMAASTAVANETVDLPRANGMTTPMRVYEPHTQGCAPLAVISPGLGGDERGYGYLAQALADDGWLAVVIGTASTSRGPLLQHLASEGFKPGLMTMLTNPALYRDRLGDIGAALSWARRRCAPPFVAMLGHSMGAITTMMEAGAHDRLGVVGEIRFDAYVAISAEGPGSVFTEHAWQDIRKPVFVLTGTRDRGTEGDWHWRTKPYADLPNGCAWLGVIDGATHMNFGGRGAAEGVTAITVKAVIAFLDGVRSGHCPVPLPQPGADFEHK